MANQQMDLNPDTTLGGQLIHTDLTHNEKGNPHPQYLNLYGVGRSNVSTSTTRIFKVATVKVSKTGVYALLVLDFFRADLNVAVFEPFGRLYLKMGVLSTSQFATLKVSAPNSFCEFYLNIVSQDATSITVEVYLKDLEVTTIDTRYHFIPYQTLTFDPVYTTFTFYRDTDWIASLPSGATLSGYLATETVSTLTIFSANGWTQTAGRTSSVLKKTDSKLIHGHLEISPLTAGTAPPYPQVCNLPYIAKSDYSFSATAELADGTFIPAVIKIATLNSGAGPSQMTVYGLTGRTNITNVTCDFKYETN